MDKIFINIASYRDPTLIKTIKDALNKAKNPDRLVFAIGLQYYKNEIPNLSFINNNQLKILTYDVDTRPGLVKVRYELSKLVTDEKYFLMIDSHTNFEQDWDESLINEITTYGNKTVLSGFPNNLNADYRYAFYKDDITIDTIMYKKDNNPLIYFVIRSFIFTYIDFLKEVGLDKHSQYINEELYISWRIFMSGWNIFVPKVKITQHLEHRNLYLDYAWGLPPTKSRKKRVPIERFIPVSPDPYEDHLEMYKTMLTNFPGKYSVNSNIDPLEFWKLRALDFDLVKEISLKFGAK